MFLFLSFHPFYAHSFCSIFLLLEFVNKCTVAFKSANCTFQWVAALHRALAIPDGDRMSNEQTAKACQSGRNPNLCEICCAPPPQSDVLSLVGQGGDGVAGAAKLNTCSRCRLTDDIVANWTLLIQRETKTKQIDFSSRFMKSWWRRCATEKACNG